MAKRIICWPELLPDGQAVLFTIHGSPGGLDARRWRPGFCEPGLRTVVVRGGVTALRSKRAWLAMRAEREGGISSTRNGTLRRSRSICRRLGDARYALPVIPQVTTDERGGVDAVVARNGTLAYVFGVHACSCRRARSCGGPQGARRRSGAAAPVCFPRLSRDWHAPRVLHRSGGDLWIWI